MTSPVPTLHPFDQAIALELQADGHWLGHTSPAYANMVGPFGGITAAQMLNAVLLQTGLISEPITWLAEQKGAMAAVIITKAWLSVPLFMAFFLAGLQGVSGDQVDAARVDGCENAGVLRYVILPHLAPTMIIVTILGAMGNLQAFDVIYAMTQGGPIKATTMLSVEVYKQAFQNWDMGTACAVGVLWFVTIAVPTVFYLRLLFKREG